MNDELKILNDLPKYRASKGFESQLLTQAMNVHDDNIAAEGASALSPKAPIWLGFAMAASLALGAMIGYGGLGWSEQVGLLSSDIAASQWGEDSDFLASNAYSEFWSELDG